MSRIGADMARFRRRDAEIEAVQYRRSDNDLEMREFFGADYDLVLLYDPTTDRRYVPTIGGRVFVAPDDWIIREPNGEYMPCNPSAFEKMYEPVLPATTLPPRS